MPAPLAPGPWPAVTLGVALLSGSTVRRGREFRDTRGGVIRAHDGARARDPVLAAPALRARRERGRWYVDMERTAAMPARGVSEASAAQHGRA